MAISLAVLITTFSPRMRGCFRVQELKAAKLRVLPAYAGMFPAFVSAIEDQKGSPRVCGDVSSSMNAMPAEARFSPRMRGCF